MVSISMYVAPVPNCAGGFEREDLSAADIKMIRVGLALKNVHVRKSIHSFRGVSFVIRHHSEQMQSIVCSWPAES
jgi:hypothetical protein